MSAARCCNVLVWCLVLRCVVSALWEDVQVGGGFCELIYFLCFRSVEDLVSE